VSYKGKDGANGSQGEAGQAGTSVVSITPLYYLKKAGSNNAVPSAPTINNNITIETTD